MRPGGQTGTLQVICVKYRAEQEKEARWTDRQASGDLRTRTSCTRKGSPVDRPARLRRSAYKIELKEEKRKAQTTLENYREWRSKTRVVLPMSNKDVFDVLNGSVEPVPANTDSDTPDTPTNLVEIQRWKRACETLFSVLCLVTSGPAATLLRHMKTELRREVWDTGRRCGTLL